MAEADNKTRATDNDVRTFLEAIEHPVRRADALVLDDLFRDVTGWAPKMWGPTIVGYGAYHYIYDSGREGDMCATGFSPRKANLSLYIMPGYQDFGEILERLGKHKTGVACLYINKLADVDLSVVGEIIRAGLVDLDARWPVSPS
jgi:hypothetical protein